MIAGVGFPRYFVGQDRLQQTLKIGWQLSILWLPKLRLRNLSRPKGAGTCVPYQRIS